MTFRRKIYDDIGLFFFKKRVNTLTIADIQLYKAKIRIIHNGSKRAEIAGVGQLVKADDTVIRVSGKHVKNKI